MTVTEADLERVYGELSHRLEELKRNGRSNLPVGTSETTEIDAWAHCSLATCKANAQRKVRAIREVRSYTMGDRSGGGGGGDISILLLMGHVENSYTYLRFKNESEMYCDVCPRDENGRGRLLELAEQQRPAYPPISGHDPMALVKRMRGQLPEWNDEGTKMRADEVAPADPDRIAHLEGQLAAVMTLLQGGKADPLAAFMAVNEADTKLPPGIRHRGEKFQARLNKSETPEGEAEVILGSFDTLDEAVAERESALARVAEAQALADAA